MNAFAAGVAAMFRDPNMSVAAIYRAGGDGAGIPIRVIRRSPDAIGRFGEGRFVTDTLFIDVRLADVAQLAPGDTFEIGGELFEVRGEPVRDGERLIWSSEVRGP